MIFFRMGCNFYVKNKLKFEIFDEKKNLQTKMFLNSDILTKNLVIFKRWPALKDEKF